MNSTAESTTCIREIEFAFSFECATCYMYVQMGGWLGGRRQRRCSNFVFMFHVQVSKIECSYRLSLCLSWGTALWSNSFFLSFFSFRFCFVLFCFVSFFFTHAVDFVEHFLLLCDECFSFIYSPPPAPVVDWASDWAFQLSSLWHLQFKQKMTAGTPLWRCQP